MVVVERIGADTIANKDGQTFYRVIVKTDKAALGNSGNPLPIIPGMVAEVEVITGSKTVMNYMTKPLLRMRQCCGQMQKGTSCASPQ